MSLFSRRTALIALAALGLAACGDTMAGTDRTSAASRPSGALNEMAIGDTDAPVTLVEYASVTCGACAQFHRDVYPPIKTDYVDTGKVRFVFREFPTPPEELAMAGFVIARCAGDEAYFDVLNDLFSNQAGIIQAARAGAARSAMMAVAERHGIEGEAAFEACLNDVDIRKAIADIVLAGEAAGVNSTPTLLINGRKLENTLQSRTAEGLSALIDAELAAAADGDD